MTARASVLTPSFQYLFGSHFQRGFLVVLSRLAPCLLAVHLNGFAERGTEVLQQFGARFALRVDARNLLHPADPPALVLANAFDTLLACGQSQK